MVVEARQSFQFFRQKTWFLGNNIPANILLDEDVLKMSFILAFKTFWSRRMCSPQPNVFRRRLGQDHYIRLSNTSSRRLQEVLQKCLQDIFKTSSRHFEDVFKTSCKDIFKTYHQVKLFLLTCLRDVFKTFLRRTTKTVINRGFAQVTLLRNLWSVYKISQGDKSFSSFSFHFVTPFSGCLQRRIQNLIEQLQWRFFLRKYLTSQVL